MTKAQRFSIYERDQIDAFRSQKLSEWQIATKINRSTTLVHAAKSSVGDWHSTKR